MIDASSCPCRECAAGRMRVVATGPLHDQRLEHEAVLTLADEEECAHCHVVGPVSEACRGCQAHDGAELRPSRWGPSLPPLDAQQWQCLICETVASPLVRCPRCGAEADLRRDAFPRDPRGQVVPERVTGFVRGPDGRWPPPRSKSCG